MPDSPADMRVIIEFTGQEVAMLLLALQCTELVPADMKPPPALVPQLDALQIKLATAAILEIKAAGG